MEIPTELGKLMGIGWRHTALTPIEVRSRALPFTSRPQDLEGVTTPHDDAFVIRATIANYDVARIFVDTGSSVNVLYKDAFDRMQIDQEELQPMATSLFRFSGHEVQPLGQIQLPLSLGEEPLWRTHKHPLHNGGRSVRLQCHLGRPALSSFGAVVSTFHQKLKFPDL
ncbi:uncharacterized protein LOC141812464 [Curcuma longa]|uniref:uncharacterized protein LOC141812464 n=1 Tax=Curcuma longa TaxID=136217 RepID=UPI003D9F7DA2